MTPARARSRARLALVGCALWLVGVEAMPALHEAMHDRLAPHHHAAGSIVTVSFEDTTHFHPDGTIHYVAPAEQPAAQPPGPFDHHDRAPQDRRVSNDAGHAAGLAHHAAALAPAPPPVTSPLPVDRRPSWVVVTQSLELVARDPLAATARGPPAVA